MFSYFLRGGVLMYPLLLCSVLMVAVVIERFIVFTRARKSQNRIMGKIREYLDQGIVEAAVAYCDQVRGPAAMIIKSGLSVHAQGSRSMESAFQRAAQEQVPLMERNLPVLSTIASISTLIGFTGTVLGMIQAFDAIAAAGATSPAIVASGVAQALITTAAGLLIAIPTVIFYHMFNHWLKIFVQKTERACEELIAITEKQ